MSILGCRIKIRHASHLTQPQAFCAVHGQVTLRVEGDPVIAFGEGALRLVEFEIEGMQRDDAKKLIGKSLRTRLVWHVVKHGVGDLS